MTDSHSNYFHPLRPTRTIRDPIHGAIRLTETEMRIVDQPLFRRLHRIRQNGLLYLVFPSASHSRFEHSLGTTSVADAMLQALYSNGRVGARKEPAAVVALEDASNGQAVDLNGIPPETTETLFRLTRIAALVHDLGHGPFSHHFEAFGPLVAEIADLCHADNELSYLLPILAMEDEDNRKNPRVKHEILSCLLFAEIARELELERTDSRVVAAVILGRPEICPLENLRRLIPVMNDIVASAPADADRMDYVERDSRSVGVSYGLFDRDRLLKSLLPYVDDDGSVRLGIKKSGARAVENFIQARFELYVQVYYHKTNLAVQFMLDEIAALAAAETKSVFDWSSMDSLQVTYLALSDERFLQVLRGKDPEWVLDNQAINQLAEGISARRLWKRVFDGAPEEWSRAKEIAEATGHPVLARKVDPKATKDLEDGARLLIRKHGGVYSYSRRQWKDQSPIIKALSEAEGRIAGVYLKADDSSVARELRLRLWQLEPEET